MSRGISKRRVEKMKEVIAKKQPDLCVILENVHDAHNIGAVLRSCESVGVQEVYLLYTEDHLYKKNMKLGKRTSSGARKWLNVYLTNDLENCVSLVREKYIRLLGTRLDDKASSIFDVDLVEPCALVFGNEKAGISDQLAKHLDGNFLIPQVGFVSSLNISVACAVSLYEALRQRIRAGKYQETFNENDPVHQELLTEYMDRAQVRTTGRRPQKGLDQ